MPFLSWLTTLPPPVNGIIQGALPPIILAILFSLVPYVFRQLIQRLDGIPLRTQIELKLQKRYFGFLLIQGFIVGVLSSGLVAAISQIAENPGEAVTFLANRLPSSAIFYITLIMATGLGGASGAILQVVKLLIYYLKVKLLGSNPRSLQKARFAMPSVKFGQGYPQQLLTAVIALSFAAIAPLVTGFATMAFVLWLFVFKYLALYVYDIAPSQETGGLFFKTALNQLFAGIYIYCLCLIGLFFLSRDTQNQVSAAPQGALMAVLMGICVLFQIWLNWKLNPTSMYLSTALADETRANERRYAEEMHAAKIGKTGSTVAASESRAIEAGAAAGSMAAGEKLGPGNADLEAARAPSVDFTHQDAEMDGGLNHNAFEHPALWRDQPTIWLPRDPLGLSQEAVSRARRRNVLITDDDATIDEKGKVDITRDTVPGEDFNPNM